MDQERPRRRRTRTGSQAVPAAQVLERGATVGLEELRAALRDDETVYAALQRHQALAEHAGVEPSALLGGDSLTVMREQMASEAEVAEVIEARFQAAFGEGARTLPLPAEAAAPPTPAVAPTPQRAPVPAAPSTAAAEPTWNQGPEPASVFATSPLPATLPPGLQPATSGPRPTDEVVDHYMNVHWDSTDLHEQARRFGVWPEQIGTELDRWIPVQASPEVRAGANLLVGLGAGLLDAFFEAFAKAIPGIGIVGQLAFSLRDGWRQVGRHAAQDDWGGAIFTGIRYTLAGLSGMVRNLGDVFTVAADAAHVLAPFTLGISEGVGVPAIVLAEGCRLISAVMDSMVLGLDFGLTTYSVIRANQAEASGQFARQAAFRDLARGHAFRMIESTFKTVASWIGVGIGAAVPTGAPTTIGAMVIQSGRKFIETFGRVLGKNGWQTGTNVIHRLRKSRSLETLTTQVTVLNDASVAVGLGDVMSRSRDGLLGADYLERTALQTSGTQAALTLDASRQITLTLMDEGMDSLEAEPPQYTQALVNQFLAEGSGIGVLDVLDFVTRPSEWIRVMFAGTRWALTTALDLGLEGLSGLAGLAESALTNIAQPIVEYIEAFIVENKPAMDELLKSLNERLQEQRVTLQGIRDALTAAEQLGAWAQSFADDAGQLDQLTQPMIDALQGARIDRDSLDVPDWIPEWTYGWAVDAINEAVDGAVGLATQVRDTIRENLDEVADDVGATIDRQLAFLQEVFAAGGDLETLLAEELALVQRLSAEATELFTRWDGRIPIEFDGAAQWLREVADQAAGATNAARQTEFTTFIETVAQVYVDDWKRRHADDVYENFWPSMPPHELAAVREAAALLTANYDAVMSSPTSPHRDEARRRRAELDAAVGAALATAGQQGSEALSRLWAAEERIAALALLPLPIVEVVRPEPVVVQFAYDRPREGESGVLGGLDAAIGLARSGHALHVVGHASVEGSDAYNLALGRRRAHWVAEQLRAAVPGVEVTTTSVGESAAGQADADEYVHEDWRKAVITVVEDR